VMPVYNAAIYVDAAVKSILQQSFVDFEFIIIDDGSTDDSLDIIRRASRGDERCRIVSRENRGIVNTANQGTELSRGKYIFRMDADDIARPNRFEVQMRYLEAHPECVALGSRVLLIDSEGLPIMEMIDAYTHDEIDDSNMRGRMSFICNPSAAMRRSAMIAIGGYREKFEFAQDLDLFLRLAEIGRIANIDQVLLEYRQHHAAVGYAKGEKQRRYAQTAVMDANLRRGVVSPNVGIILNPPAANGSPADDHRKWAWWALRGGFPRTARKHAWKALKLDSWNRDNVLLIACSIRGY
jgi:glycosyltransferase involved in cell wall biosynthesis